MGNMGLRVGDRFGSILVTGYKSTRAKQCHVNYQVNDFAPNAAGNVAGAGPANLADSDEGGNAALAVLGVGFAMVALVVVVAAVVLNKRYGRNGKYVWSDAESDFSQGSMVSATSAVSAA